MRNEELIEYLQQYPNNAIPSFIVANPRDRKYYELKNVICITDMECPVFCIEVGNTQDMDEEMVKACEEDEGKALMNVKEEKK